MRTRATAIGLVAVLGAALAPSPPTAAAIPAPLDIGLRRLLRLARIEAPPPGIGLRVHAHFPIDRPLELAGTRLASLTADVTPGREVVVRNAIAADGAHPHETLDECSDPAFAASGPVWDARDVPVAWRFAKRTVPRYRRPDSTLRRVRQAHMMWGHYRARCSADAPPAFEFNYRGTTRKRLGFDRRNVIDFGPLKNVVAVNYTWYSGRRILEVDLRLSNRVPWANRPWNQESYQVINVVTHELGHQIGLDDLGTPHEALTMFGIIGKGELKKVTLGRGDIRGAQLIGP